ncbi:MAG: S-layer homology domain-containing protein [Oscillospiraceae bacterium]
MKTLKKTLCLVLAVVMAVGTLALSASATDFVDDADIEYNEAVEVLTGLGVINGKDGNKFDPEGTLTRAEGAKLVTYALLGTDTADKLKATSAPFSDVPTSNWAAGSVAYCSAAGIIDGYQGKFDPNGKLTGVAFAKMLLVALDIDGEYTGNNWDVNVLLASENAGLAKGISGFDYYANITRDEAAQMLLNALFIGEKTVTTTATRYVLTANAEASEALLAVSGTYYSTFDGAKAAAVAADKDAIYGKDYTVSSMSIASEKVEGSLADTVFGLSKDKDSDDFGRPGVTYAVDGDSLVFVADTPVLTYTTEVSSKAIYSALGLKKTATATVYTDGVSSGSFSIANNNTSSKVGGNGTLVEVYKVSSTAYTVVVINTYIGTVYSVKTTTEPTTGVATTTLTLNSKESGLTTTDFVDFAKKDVVLYTKAGSTIMSMEKADVISGTLTKAVNSKDFTIGGSVYQIGATSTLDAAAIIGTDNANMGKTVSYYVDNYGYLMASVSATSVATAGTYINVLAAEKPSNTTDWMSGTSSEYTGKVYGILSDGTYGTYTVNYGETSTAAATGIYEYELNDDGELVLGTKDASVSTSSTEFKSGATTVNGKILNSNTVFVFYTTESKSANIKSITVKTGNANCGVVPAGAKIVAENNVALVVYVGGDYDDGTVVADAAFVDASTKKVTTSSEVTSSGTVTTTVYTYTAYTADGDELTLTSKTLNLADDADGVYYYNEDNTIGASVTTVTGTIKLYGSTIMVGSTYYNYNTDMVCFLGEDAALADNQTVVAIAKNGTLTHIWVTADAPEVED